MLISMKGIGEILAPRLIAEVGDMHRFYSSSALIVYTGIDAPAYQMDLCIFFTDSADLE
ncbi:MAG: transposase [Lachnospiraceae bacterium]|uniref:transposase n=1 Tax=Mediterraneibacter gnavus TaxID=33038 RepID=UPI0034A47CB4